VTLQMCFLLFTVRMRKAGDCGLYRLRHGPACRAHKNARGRVPIVAGLVYIEDLYFKGEGCVRWYAPCWKAAGSVCIFWSAHKCCDFTLAHGHAALIPSPYDLRGAQQHCVTYRSEARTRIGGGTWPIPI
jgi:hypothetical protein